MSETAIQIREGDFAQALFFQAVFPATRSSVSQLPSVLGRHRIYSGSDDPTTGEKSYMHVMREEYGK